MSAPELPDPRTRDRPVVVNRHWYEGKDDHGNRRRIPKPWIYIGRGTELGNPYTVAEHGQDALILYREELLHRLRRNDKKLLEAMRAITVEHHLVCSCKPRPCHGDVVVEIWVWMNERGYFRR